MDCRRNPSDVTFPCVTSGVIDRRAAKASGNPQSNREPIRAAALAAGLLFLLAGCSITTRSGTRYEMLWKERVTYNGDARIVIESGPDVDAMAGVSGPAVAILTGSLWGLVASAMKDTVGTAREIVTAPVRWADNLTTGAR